MRLRSAGRQPASLDSTRVHHATRPDCRRRSQQPVRPHRAARRRRLLGRHGHVARRSAHGARPLDSRCRARRPEPAGRQRLRSAPALAAATAERLAARDRADGQRDGRERHRGFAPRHLGLPAQADQHSAPAQLARADSPPVRTDRRSAVAAGIAAPSGPLRRAGRPQRRDAARVRHDRAQRPHRDGRAVLGRSRHRQEAGRAHAARAEPAPQGAVRVVRLPDARAGRPAWRVARQRAVRPRARRLRRRGAPRVGPVRASRRRHAVPRRNHRTAARAAGSAAARARFAELHADRRYELDHQRFPADRGHAPPGA